MKTDSTENSTGKFEYHLARQGSYSGLLIEKITDDINIYVFGFEVKTVSCLALRLVLKTS